MIGELLMGSTSRRLLSRHLRKGTVRPDAWTADQLSALWQQFDHGTQRALLRLHRAAEEARLVKLGARLASITAPAQIVWGEADPWFEPGFADAYAALLRHVEIRRVAGAGHWPWLDEPRVVDLVADFLDRP